MSRRLKECAWFDPSKCIYPDFPEKGVNFIDVFSVLREPEARLTAKMLMNDNDADLIFAPESRGFLFAGYFGFNRLVPLRKAGKLPGTLNSFSYKKEYGTDALYYQVDAIRDILSKKGKSKGKVKVAFVDDCLATGGTACGFIDALNQLKIDNYTFEVTSCIFLIEIEDLNGRSSILSRGSKCKSLYLL